MNAEVAHPVSQSRRQPLRQRDGQGDDGQKKIPKQKRMRKGLAPTMLAVVDADDLHRVDGAEEGGRRKCIEKDSRARRRLGHLDRQGRAFNLRICNGFHAARPFPSAISVNPYSRLQNPEKARDRTRIAALQNIARLSVREGKAAGIEDLLQHPRADAIGGGGGCEPWTGRRTQPTLSFSPTSAK